MSLAEIRKKLEQFQTYPCKMYHETILYNKMSTQSCNANGGADYPRAGLCPPEVRRRRIGCAHTSANHSFNMILDQLAGQNDKFTPFQQDFNRIITDIYQTDHKRGDLEKELTRAHLSEDDGLQKQLKQQIDALESSHDEYISQLENIRKAIIRLL